MVAILLSILGFILVASSLLVTTLSVQEIHEKKDQLVGFYTKLYVTEWLSQGEEILDLMERYLLIHENEIEHPDFKNDIPFNTRFMIHMDQIVQIKDHITGVGLGTPYGTFFVDLPGRFICWSNETERDYPCCNYTETHQPGPIYAQRLLYDNYTLSERFIPPGSNPHFDYRVVDNGWYYNALLYNQTTYVWSHFFSAIRELTSTITKKYYDSNGVFRGVLCVWFNSAAVGDFLNEIVKVDSQRSKIFVVDKKNGILLATTTEDNIYTIVEEDMYQRVERVKPEECENPIIQNTAQWLLRKYGGKWENVDTDTCSEVVGSQLVRTESLNITGFEVVFVYLESMYYSYGRIYVVLLSVTISFSAVAVFLASCFSMCIIYWVTMPFFSLIRKFRDVEKMKLDNIKIRFISPIYEIGMIQRQFIFTVAKLRDFRRFLPTRLLDDRESCVDEKEERKSIVSLGNQGSSEARASTALFLQSRGLEKFDVGLRIVEKCLVVIRMFILPNKREAFNESLTVFSKFFGEFLASVGTTKHGHFRKGELHDFQMLGFTFFHKSFEMGLDSAKRTLKAFLMLRSKYELYEIDCFAYVDFEDVYEGVLGSNQLRKHLASGKYQEITYELSKNIRPVTYFEGEYEGIIFVGERCCNRGNLMNSCSETHCFKPVDIINDGDGPGVLYRYALSQDSTPQEWMYELRDKKNAARYEKVEESLEEMKNGRYSAALDLLYEFQENLSWEGEDIEVSRLVKFCQLQVEKVENQKLNDYVVEITIGKSLLFNQLSVKERMKIFD